LRAHFYSSIRASLALRGLVVVSAMHLSETR
jgi:hypothetical protein